MIDAVAAILLIESEFPELSEELHDGMWDGLLHVQMGRFSDFAQKCIETSDQTTLARVFAIALHLWSQGDAAVINAINVSFLEHLDSDDAERKNQWVYRDMPPVLRTAFDDMAAYNARMRESAHGHDSL